MICPRNCGLTNCDHGVGEDPHPAPQGATVFMDSEKFEDAIAGALVTLLYVDRVRLERSLRQARDGQYRPFSEIVAEKRP